MATAGSINTITNIISCQDTISSFEKICNNKTMNSSKNLQIIATRLRAAREEIKLSQGEVADLLDIDRGAYGHFETGRTIPRVEYLIKLTDILGKPLNWLVGLPSNDLSDNEAELLHLYRQLSKQSRSDIMEFCRLLAARSR